MVVAQKIRALQHPLVKDPPTKEYDVRFTDNKGYGRYIGMMYAREKTPTTFSVRKSLESQ